jgi:hypothetical protein
METNMASKMTLGETESAIANVAIAANVAVKWHTVAGQAVVCGVGDKPIGYTQEAVAAGATFTFWRAVRGNRYYVSGSGVAAGDLVKCAASGALTTEGTATTVTTATVGQARTASDSSNLFECTTF